MPGRSRELGFLRPDDQRPLGASRIRAAARVRWLRVHGRHAVRGADRADVLVGRGAGGRLLGVRRGVVGRETPMPCEQRQGFIVCSARPRPRRCVVCRQAGATQLCDFVTRPGKTCDAPLHRGCARRGGPDTDYCPHHPRGASSTASVHAEGARTEAVVGGSHHDARDNGSRPSYTTRVVPPHTALRPGLTPVGPPRPSTSISPAEGPAEKGPAGPSAPSSSTPGSKA